MSYHNLDEGLSVLNLTDSSKDSIPRTADHMDACMETPEKGDSTHSFYYFRNYPNAQV